MKIDSDLKKKLFKFKSSFCEKSKNIKKKFGEKEYYYLKGKINNMVEDNDININQLIKIKKVLYDYKDDFDDLIKDINKIMCTFEKNKTKKSQSDISSKQNYNNDSLEKSKCHSEEKSKCHSEEKSKCHCEEKSKCHCEGKSKCHCNEKSKCCNKILINFEKEKCQNQNMCSYYDDKDQSDNKLVRFIQTTSNDNLIEVNKLTIDPILVKENSIPYKPFQDDVFVRKINMKVDTMERVHILTTEFIEDQPDIYYVLSAYDKNLQVITRFPIQKQVSVTYQDNTIDQNQIALAIDWKDRIYVSIPINPVIEDPNSIYITVLRYIFNNNTYVLDPTFNTFEVTNTNSIKITRKDTILPQTKITSMVIDNNFNAYVSSGMNGTVTSGTNVLNTDGPDAVIFRSSGKNIDWIKLITAPSQPDRIMFAPYYLPDVGYDLTLDPKNDNNLYVSGNISNINGFGSIILFDNIDISVTSNASFGFVIKMQTLDGQIIWVNTLQSVIPVTYPLPNPDDQFTLYPSVSTATGITVDFDGFIRVVGSVSTQCKTVTNDKFGFDPITTEKISYPIWGYMWTLNPSGSSVSIQHLRTKFGDTYTDAYGITRNLDGTFLITGNSSNETNQFISPTEADKIFEIIDDVDFGPWIKSRLPSDPVNPMGDNIKLSQIFNSINGTTLTGEKWIIFVSCADWCKPCAQSSANYGAKSLAIPGGFLENYAPTGVMIFDTLSQNIFLGTYTNIVDQRNEVNAWMLGDRPYNAVPNSGYDFKQYFNSNVDQNLGIDNIGNYMVSLDYELKLGTPPFFPSMLLIGTTDDPTKFKIYTYFNRVHPDLFAQSGALSALYNFGIVQSAITISPFLNNNKFITYNTVASKINKSGSSIWSYFADPSTFNFSYVLAKIISPISDFQGYYYFLDYVVDFEGGFILGDKLTISKIRADEYKILYTPFAKKNTTEYKKYDISFSGTVIPIDKTKQIVVRGMYYWTDLDGNFSLYRYADAQLKGIGLCQNKILLL